MLVTCCVCPFWDAQGMLSGEERQHGRGYQDIDFTYLRPHQLRIRIPRELRSKFYQLRAAVMSALVSTDRSKLFDAFLKKNCRPMQSLKQAPYKGEEAAESPAAAGRGPPTRSR